MWSGSRPRRRLLPGPWPLSEQCDGWLQQDLTSSRPQRYDSPFQQGPSSSRPSGGADMFSPWLPPLSACPGDARSVSVQVNPASCCSTSSFSPMCGNLDPVDGPPGLTGKLTGYVEPSYYGIDSSDLMSPRFPSGSSLPNDMCGPPLLSDWQKCRQVSAGEWLRPPAPRHGLEPGFFANANGASSIMQLQVNARASRRLGANMAASVMQNDESWMFLQLEAGPRLDQMALRSEHVVNGITNLGNFSRCRAGKDWTPTRQLCDRTLPRVPNFPMLNFDPTADSMNCIHPSEYFRSPDSRSAVSSRLNALEFHNFSGDRAAFPVETPGRDAIAALQRTPCHFSSASFSATSPCALSLLPLPGAPVSVSGSQEASQPSRCSLDPSRVTAQDYNPIFVSSHTSPLQGRHPLDRLEDEAVSFQQRETSSISDADDGVGFGCSIGADSYVTGRHCEVNKESHRRQGTCDENWDPWKNRRKRQKMSCSPPLCATEDPQIHYEIWKSSSERLVSPGSQMPPPEKSSESLPSVITVPASLGESAFSGPHLPPGLHTGVPKKLDRNRRSDNRSESSAGLPGIAVLADSTETCLDTCSVSNGESMNPMEWNDWEMSHQESSGSSLSPNDATTPSDSAVPGAETNGLVESTSGETELQIRAGKLPQLQKAQSMEANSKRHSVEQTSPSVGKNAKRRRKSRKCSLSESRNQDSPFAGNEKSSPRLQKVAKQRLSERLTERLTSTAVPGSNKSEKPGISGTSNVSGKLTFTSRPGLSRSSKMEAPYALRSRKEKTHKQDACLCHNSCKDAKTCPQNLKRKCRALTREEALSETASSSPEDSGTAISKLVYSRREDNSVGSKQSYLNLLSRTTEEETDCIPNPGAAQPVWKKKQIGSGTEETVRMSADSSGSENTHADTEAVCSPEGPSDALDARNASLYHNAQQIERDSVSEFSLLDVHNKKKNGQMTSSQSPQTRADQFVFKESWCVAPYSTGDPVSSERPDQFHMQDPFRDAMLISYRDYQVGGQGSPRRQTPGARRETDNAPAPRKTSQPPQDPTTPDSFSPCTPPLPDSELGTSLLPDDRNSQNPAVDEASHENNVVSSSDNTGALSVSCREDAVMVHLNGVESDSEDSIILLSSPCGMNGGGIRTKTVPRRKKPRTIVIDSSPEREKERPAKKRVPVTLSALKAARSLQPVVNIVRVSEEDMELLSLPAGSKTSKTGRTMKPATMPLDSAVSSGHVTSRSKSLSTVNSQDGSSGSEKDEMSSTGSDESQISKRPKKRKLVAEENASDSRLRSRKGSTQEAQKVVEKPSSGDVLSGSSSTDADKLSYLIEDVLIPRRVLEKVVPDTKSKTPVTRSSSSKQNYCSAQEMANEDAAATSSNMEDTGISNAALASLQQGRQVGMNSENSTFTCQNPFLTVSAGNGAGTIFVPMPPQLKSAARLPSRRKAAVRPMRQNGQKPPRLGAKEKACLYCGEFRSRSKTEMRSHVSKKHRFHCAKCRLDLPNKAAVQTHRLQQHLAELLFCPLCSRHFLSAGFYRSHLKGAEHQKLLSVQQATLSTVISLAQQTTNGTDHQEAGSTGSQPPAGTGDEGSSLSLLDESPWNWDLQELNSFQTEDSADGLLSGTVDLMCGADAQDLPFDIDLLDMDLLNISVNSSPAPHQPCAQAASEAGSQSQASLQQSADAASLSEQWTSAVASFLPEMDNGIQASQSSQEVTFRQQSFPFSPPGVGLSTISTSQAGEFLSATGVPCAVTGAVEGMSQAGSHLPGVPSCSPLAPNTPKSGQSGPLLGKQQADVARVSGGPGQTSQRGVQAKTAQTKTIQAMTVQGVIHPEENSVDPEFLRAKLDRLLMEIADDIYGEESAME